MRALPAATPLVPFEKAAVAQSDRGKRVKQRDYLADGRIPVIDQGQSPVGGYTNDDDFAFMGELPVILFGDHTRAVKLVDRPFAVGADGIKIFRPAEGVRAKYLYYWMKSAPLPDRGYGRHYQYLRQLLIPLPTPKQQDEVVAEIEKQFSRLDEAVTNLKRVKANLKRHRAAVLMSAAEGALVAGGAAADWGRVQIRAVAAVISGLTKNPKRRQLPRKLPYLRVANVYANELRLDDVEEIGVADHEIEKLLVRRGDMLVVEGNGSVDQVGRVALWDGSIPNCVHQNHLIKVRFGKDVLPQWALIWLLSPDGRREIERVSSSTSGLHTLSTGKVGRLPLPLPPLTEQHRIVAEVDRRLSIIREIGAEVDTNLARAQALRSATLARAFS